MKKIIISICVVGLVSLTGCATKSASQKGLKKSPCACVYEPLPSYNNNVADKIIINSGSKSV